MLSRALPDQPPKIVSQTIMSPTAPVFSPFCCLFPSDPAVCGTAPAAGVAKAFGLSAILCVWPDPKSYPCRRLDAHAGALGPRFELSAPPWAVWAFCPPERARECFGETLRFAAAEGYKRAGFVSPVPGGFASGLYPAESSSRAAFDNEWPGAPSEACYPRGCSPERRKAAASEISETFAEAAELLFAGFPDEACARLRLLADSAAADAFGAEPDPGICRLLAQALRGAVPEFDFFIEQGFDLDNRAFMALAGAGAGALRSACEKSALQIPSAAHACGPKPRL